MNTTQRQFLHFLHDTLILLGSGSHLANLVNNPDDICQEDIDDLRNFNIKLIDNTKQKLVDINKIAISVVKNDGTNNVG